jgi:hypothetical protein
LENRHRKVSKPLELMRAAPTFDYAGLPDNVSRDLRERADRIRSLMRRQREEMIEVGRQETDRALQFWLVACDGGMCGVSW